MPLIGLEFNNSLRQLGESGAPRWVVLTIAGAGMVVFGGIALMIVLPAINGWWTARKWKGRW